MAYRLTDCGSFLTQEMKRIATAQPCQSIELIDGAFGVIRKPTLSSALEKNTYLSNQCILGLVMSKREEEHI